MGINICEHTLGSPVNAPCATGECPHNMHHPSGTRSWLISSTVRRNPSHSHSPQRPLGTPQMSSATVHTKAMTRRVRVETGNNVFINIFHTKTGIFVTNYPRGYRYIRFLHRLLSNRERSYVCSIFSLRTRRNGIIFMGTSPM